MCYSSAVNNILKITILSLLFLAIQISHFLFPFTDQWNKIISLHFRHSGSIHFLLDIDKFILILDFAKQNLYAALVQHQILREVTHLEVSVKCKSTSVARREREQVKILIHKPIFVEGVLDLLFFKMCIQVQSITFLKKLKFGEG